jgi:hypothetical protein
MNNRISFEFARFSDDKLNKIAQTIVLALADNPNFPTPSAQVTAMREAAESYNLSWLAAQSRDLEKVSVKNDDKAVLINAMKDLAYYLMTVSKGNRTILLTTGYELNKIPEPSPLITQPVIANLTDGLNPGELKVSLAARVAGAKSYLFEYTTDINAEKVNWVSAPCTSIEFTFSNLQIGKLYYCRVAATGSRRQLVYSKIVTRIVQ